MKTRLLLLLLMIAAFTSAVSGQEANSQVIAFINVNVIPMDREHVLENQTVVVQNGKITQIEPAAKAKVPAGALQIDAKGKYLMPGIAEMHGHLPHPNMSEQGAKSILSLFVINGITTVRGMFGFPNHLSLREKASKGEILSPTIYAASPALSGQSVQNPEIAQKLVKEYKRVGYDLIKVHEGLSSESYEAIVKTANEVGITFGGHVSDSVGLQQALKSKQISIEHLDGYIEALEADNSPIRNADPKTRAEKLIFHIDEKKIPALAAATRDAGAWVVPTMALWQTFYSNETAESLGKRSELKYVPAQMLNQWVQQRNDMLKDREASDDEIGRRVLELRNKILKALSDAGVKILLGSDAPQLYSVPGFSLNREMEAMVKAGLTPYQVLESGTRNVALYFKTTNETGTVEVGKRADLILLDGNPLKDIANMQKKSGVMINGRWINESEIKKMLDEIASLWQPKQAPK
jgi:imidazolonepropionase-like amidohydrolase